jgi:hypothetical protein
MQANCFYSPAPSFHCTVFPCFLYEYIHKLSLRLHFRQINLRVIDQLDLEVPARVRTRKQFSLCISKEELLGTRKQFHSMHK